MPIGVRRAGLRDGEPVAIVEERGAEADHEGDLAGRDERPKDAVVVGGSGGAGELGQPAGVEKAHPRRDRPQQFF